jgi:hypothetical protein
MPYTIKEVDKGYKVCKEDNPSKCFSEKPLTKTKAVKQLKAIGISESLEGSGKNDYVVAIPSYDRPEILKEKTLNTLISQGIKPEKIEIFVANTDEEKRYKSILDKKDYNKIIVGVKGLLEQRNFINKYYPIGKYIIEIDDDVEGIFKKKNSIKTDRSMIKINLDTFINEAYDILKEKNLYIWGINPVFNTYFTYNKITTDLRYIVGAFFGLINRHDKDILLKLESDKEDVERTILYYKKDGGVMRFNNILIKTNYYGEGGLQSEYGDKEKRLKEGKRRVEKLKELYPEYGTIKQRPSGVWEFVLKRNPKLEGAGKKLNNDLTKLDDTSVYYVSIPKTKKYEKLKQELYEVLERTNIPKIDGPRKDGRKTRGDLLGFNAWTTTFGCGNRRKFGISEFSANKKFPELFDLLIKFGNEIAPKGFEYQAITLNKDMQAKKHVDGGNAGFSVLTGLGDFTGGELNVYEPDGNNPTTYDLKDHTLIFNGSLLPHMTEPFKGRRYTIIYYKQKTPCHSEGKKMVGSGKPLDTELYNKTKEKVYSENPKHSLFRSAQVVKEYKKAGGEYDDEKKPKMNIRKWFRQKWISLNDYYYNKKIVPCGSSNTEEKFNEYPLCRPLKIAESLKPEEMKKMIDKKNELKQKPLLTNKLLKTDKYNIKSTFTGMGKDKFLIQLEKIKYPINKYLNDAKIVAKKEGYDPEKLSFANNNDNKLKYESPEGIKYFGKSGYGDFLIWKFKEKNNEVRKGYAKMKRNVFRKSHSAITKMYNLNKFSPNELAIKILW